MTITKAALVRQLKAMNIPVVKGHVRAGDIKRVLARMVKSDLVPKMDLEKAESMPPAQKREMLGMVYHAILTAMGREDTLPVLQRALEIMPEREIDLEWRAVMDGTVSKIVKTMTRGEMTQDELEELGALYEGLAVPYFRDYKGDVPQEDLEWAHDQIKEFFDRVSEGDPALTGNEPSRLGAGE